MKVRTSIAAVGAAAVLGAGAFAIPALASPHGSTHTLKFISVQKKSVFLSKTELAQQDTDVNAKGKTVGFDELYIKIVSATSGAGNVAGVTKGGILYATFKVNLKTGASSHGKVTGGTGAFKGATGTLKTKAISSTKTAVTITYHT